MGLMSKLKNILFEEEEVEIPVLEKKKESEVTYKELPKKEEQNDIFGHDYYNNDLKSTLVMEKSLEEEKPNSFKMEDEVIKSEIPKDEKTFDFPAFDEKEFEDYNFKTRETNILEKEKNKKKINIVEKPVEEEKKFHPSPIISPVYGILDKNYTPDEITNREVKNFDRKLDVDDVRKKAFGTLIEKEKIEEINPVSNIEVNEDDKILEEKLEKARTIDELLKESSDEVITLKEDLDTDTLELTKEIKDLDIKDNSDDESLEENHEFKKVDEDETLESDLFDLIDSMYENGEDGE